MLLLLWTGSHPGLGDRIERRIALARATILWERIWRAFWPATGIIGVFFAAALFGTLMWLPAGLQVLALFCAIGATAYFAYRNFHGLRLPDWHEGARRIERDNALIHRPITERVDKLLIGTGDEVAENLWRAHIRALFECQHRVKLALPHPMLGKRDPHALRFAVLALVVTGFVVAGPDWSHRLAAAFSVAGHSAPTATLDAWIDPPAYTGEAPIYLPRGDAAKAITAPVGSTLALRVHGARAQPQALFAPNSDRAPRFTGQAEDYSANGKITGNQTVSVNADGQTLGRWRIRAIPDEPPAIAFASKPGKTERNALKIAFTAADDYGVTSARALIRPVNHRKNNEVLALDLPLSSTAKTLTQTVYRDVTSHPYAGLEVEMTLEAKDAVGHLARSAPMRIKLPARIFTNPLARALVEQRQNLGLDSAAGRATATRALDALTLSPEDFYQKATGVYLAIRAAYWGLRNARHESEIAHVQDLLWQTALGIEQGGVSSAAEELRRLQQLISQALAQGAPQDVINSLLQRYQQALNRYLQKLAQNPPAANTPIPPNAKVLKPEDLQKLLDLIQQLSQTGARDKAQQLLAMLQNLLENLHMTAGPGGKGDKALSDALQGLSELMGKQRELLDKTFREQQGNSDPNSGGPKGLAEQQGRLREQLNKLMEGLGQKGGSAKKNLGEAGKQMGEAQGQLGEQELDGATEAERNALEAMRKGAGDLARNLMKQGGQQGENGNEDPLGRESGGRGPSFGSDVRVPDKSTLERARNILKELRRRAEQRGRPKEELDYIDRLLKQF